MKNKQQRLPRSYLFVPGDRPDRFDKALAAGADMVVLDLEDAVADGQKEQARAAVAAYLSPGRSICLRINGSGTPWFGDDLDLCTAAGIGAIMLPKVETPGQIAQVTERAGGRIPVLPFIETALGYWHMRETAAVPGVQRLVFGTLDFLLDLGMTARGSELNSVRLQLVLVSRLAGIAPPIAGVTQDIHDMASVENDALRARRMGFGGKLCIHPAQVAAVNACFSHSEAEVAWARKVVAAAEAAHGGAVSLEGRMIDRPVIEQARAILGYDLK